MILLQPFNEQVSLPIKIIILSVEFSAIFFKKACCSVSNLKTLPQEMSRRSAAISNAEYKPEAFIRLLISLFCTFYQKVVKMSEKSVPISEKGSFFRSYPLLKY